MCWLTWDTKARGRLSQVLVAKYDKEANRLSPQIVGQLALICALDGQMHDNLAPFVTDVFAQDASIADAAVRYEKDADAGLRELTAHWVASCDLEARLRQIIANQLTNAARLPPNTRNSVRHSNADN
jgi:hypothetical protein